MKRAIQTLEQLRADLPVTRSCAYFQTGSYAPVPLSTQQIMGELLRAENESFIALGGKGAASSFYQQAEAARQTVANLLQVQADEVAWSYNTTTATRLAVQSIRWQRGDKLAISDVEHASTFTMARGMEQALGTITTMIESGNGPTYSPERLLEELDRKLTADHRLLILCHVANTDGRRLPVAEAVQIARARGILTLVDGAQAVGVFPVDVKAIGADFYAGSGHKWLMGPAGVGFLVVNKAHLPDYNPNFMPLPPPGESLTAASRSELGTPSHVTRIGTAYSIATLQQIGLAQIEQQARTLSEQLRAGLRRIPGVRNAGPDAWSLSSSITTLQLENGTPERMQQLVGILREQYRIVTKFRPEVCGVRVAVAAFNTAEEIDKLLAALVKVVPAL
jgi:selenocysteine lyase/cysteine desulfurase